MKTKRIIQQWVGHKENASEEEIDDYVDDADYEYFVDQDEEDKELSINLDNAKNNEAKSDFT